MHKEPFKVVWEEKRSVVIFAYDEDEAIDKFNKGKFDEKDVEGEMSTAPEPYYQSNLGK